VRGCLCALCAIKRTQGLPYGSHDARRAAKRSAPDRPSLRAGEQRAARLRRRRLPTSKMADAASQKLANDLARAEARKTLWETELAGLAARREDDAAAAAAAVKESVLAREAADPLMTVHGDADGNPYARPARGGGGCAVM
jgi:hypothetical protein